MRDSRRRGGLVAAVVMAVSTVACAAPSSPSATASSIALAPGQPFDPTTVLDAMRDSRRPGGVPDQLETDAIAIALAERIWTIDGEPWSTMSAGGSCGPVRCTLEIGGSHAGAQGEDLWIFEIIPAGGEVAVIEANLRSVPPDVADAVDRLARDADSRIDDAGLVLVSARWLPPPDDETFELSYRSGNEEGSCELDLTIDVGAGEVTAQRAIDC